MKQRQGHLKLAIYLFLYIPLVSPSCSSQLRSGPPALFLGLPLRRRFLSGGSKGVEALGSGASARLRQSFISPAVGSYCQGGSWPSVATGGARRGLRVGTPLLMNLMRGGGGGDEGGAAAGEDKGRGGSSHVGQQRRVKVVVISGPTAVGKSALAERIAMSVEGGGEIISADSVQVYKGMDIGSNKPTAEERSAVPYHLIDVLPPTEEYNAADFVEQARRAILEVSSRGKLPIVVGGTGFYVQWLVYGRPAAPAPTPEAAQRAQDEVEAFGGDWDKGLERLAEVDPDYASKLGRNDFFRLRRGLEVFYTGGQPLSSYDRPQGKTVCAPPSPHQPRVFVSPYQPRIFVSPHPPRVFVSPCEPRVLSLHAWLG